jgi:hypothetical protein
MRPWIKGLRRGQGPPLRGIEPRPFRSARRGMSHAGLLIVATVLLSSVCYSQPSGVPAAAADSPVFRPPFTLRLQVDDRHYYERRFDRVPYVAESNVYLFAGETFGVNVTVAGERVFKLTYRKDPADADVEFAFTQEKSPDGPTMLLVIHNKLKKRLIMGAVMTVPGEDGVFKTSLLPVEPSLRNFESWPHPIIQLVLRNFRLSEKGTKQVER